MRINALVVYAVTVGGGIHFLNQQKVPAAVELYTNQTAVKARENIYYDESQIIVLDYPLENKTQTIVTAYFNIPSKHASQQYDEWMQSMLSLQDPMVIFTSPEYVPKMIKMRSHARNRTVLIPRSRQRSTGKTIFERILAASAGH